MTRLIKLGALAVLICAGGASRAHAASVHAAPPICSGSIQPNEARVWTGTSRTGTCYSLTKDGDSWTTWNATSGFPIHCYYEAFDMGFRDNTLTSIINFSSVNTSQLFWDHNWTGSSVTVAPGLHVANLGDPMFNQNDNTSSIAGIQQSCRPFP